MKLELDRQDDILYLTLDPKAKVADSEEIAPGIILDYDSSNVVVGVEILNISKKASAKQLENVEYKIAG